MRRKIDESMLATGFLSANRESKRRWDIYSLAREFAKQHPEPMPSSAASSLGEEASKEIGALVAFIVTTCKPMVLGPVSQLNPF